jgi:hypothetical protein
MCVHTGRPNAMSTTEREQQAGWDEHRRGVEKEGSVRGCVECAAAWNARVWGGGRERGRESAREREREGTQHSQYQTWTHSANRQFMAAQDAYLIGEEFETVEVYVPLK